MSDALDDPVAVAQANFLLTRNLLKFLYISDKIDDGDLWALLDGTIQAAEAGGKLAAAELLRSLRWDLQTNGDDHA